MRVLLAKGRIDFEARDKVGRTLLGHAIFRVLDYETPNASLEPIRVLLAAGALPAENALAAERTQQVPEGHLLLINLVSSHKLELLELLLGAGLNPNGVDMDGRPVIFSTSTRLQELEVLAKHGANLNARDVRTDRPQWSALMNAAYMSQWDQALFFLDHGVDPEYTSPDHQTVRSILTERAGTYGEPDDAEYRKLKQRLQLK
jgi:hypothetical protein